MDTLDYQKITQQFPWITSKNKHCVISPDSDGLLSALFMSHHLHWKIKGFYDGKVLLLEKNSNPSSVIYLDVEIYRKGVRSVGQHMLLPNKQQIPSNWNNFENCIAANNLREFDAKNDFRNKYPFGTIHLLISIIGNIMQLEKNPEIIAPLMYADGTFKNIFGYPENSLSWFHFLQATKNDILREVFFTKQTSTAEQMEMMKNLFQTIREVGGATRGGEKIKISERGGKNIGSIIQDRGQVYIEKEEVRKSEAILEMFANFTGWKYNKSLWTWGNFNHFQFTKKILDNTTSFNKRNEILETDPISFAITATNRMEYTIDQNKVFG